LARVAIRKCKNTHFIL